MKDHPILFSGSMVRALLREQNPKTQTRRLITKANSVVGFNNRTGLLANVDLLRARPTSDGHLLAWHKNHGDDALVMPRVKPGDRLWVRETHLAFDVGRVHYRADFQEDKKGEREHGVVWTPSIHMPRWASRITLEITGVRVERLHDISAGDVRAEGVRLPVMKDGRHHSPAVCIPNPYDPGKKFDDWAIDDFWRAAFACAWDDINKKRAGWALNPWVWVVSFKRVEP